MVAAWYNNQYPVSLSMQIPRLGLQLRRSFQPCRVILLPTTATATATATALHDERCCLLSPGGMADLADVRQGEHGDQVSGNK